VSGIALASDVDRFRGLIAHRLGLQFTAARTELLGDVLRRRLDRSGASAAVYLGSLDAAPERAELAALAGELTVAETYFFRHSEQLRAFQETALPERRRANATLGSLRLLSAGCASGEEPYSLAILLRETAGDPGWQVEIRAVDLNPAALAKAAAAHYSPWALRETPAAVQSRWFRAAGREFLLDETIRDAVAFEQRNLADEDSELWRPATFDIVFCRNVVMYFAPEAARRLMTRIARALRPGGYLFLGHAETLRGLSEDFDLRHTQNTFYYQLKAGAARPAAPVAARLPRDPPATSAAEPWLDSIREASARVAGLAATPWRPVAPPRDLAPIFELLRDERFGDALAAARALPPGDARNPDVQLLEATLLAHVQRLPAAADACRRLLAIDELNAGAHYVLALCREGAGDCAGAAEHDRVAAYLDPSFAMPRLHLGLMARRTGARQAARRELAEAAVLLEREDASRLLLFGGGFGRHALLVLCRSAMRDCGGER
jgi:chemotaxis protein methyltransferase CheR